MRSCSLLAGLLYILTAAQVAVFVIALWQNNWQLETLRNNPWVRALAQRPHMLHPSPVDFVQLQASVNGRRRAAASEEGVTPFNSVLNLRGTKCRQAYHRGVFSSCTGL